MNMPFGSRIQRDVAIPSIFLIMIALIAGVVGCTLPPVQIQDWDDLNAIRDNPGGRYRLMNDLDSASAGYWTLASNMADYRKGWQPIGTPDNPFTGSFDGQGFEIRGLYIDRPDQNEVGLFGLVDEAGTIKDVGVVSATVTGKQCVGGVVGNNSGTVSNSYFSGLVTGDHYLGGLVGGNGGTVTNSHYNYEEVLINGENRITIGALCAEDLQQWLANDKFLDVNQRLFKENGRYLVNNVSDFKELLAFGQDSSLRFGLTDDLDLGSEANFCIPYLAGEFDGNGRKILNLTLDSDSASQAGLFGYLASSGKISQLGVENVNVTGAYLVGGLLGGNDGTVTNSYAIGNVTGDDYVGGLIGHNWKGTVSNSYSMGSVAGKWDTGGLVGINEGTLTNCYSSSSITGWYSAGGLAGINAGSVINSYSSGSVTAWYSVGSLVGINEGSLSNSYSSGSVTGWYSVGGLAGINSETVNNSYSIASVSGRSGVGGLVGTNHGSVRYSYVTGSVTGSVAGERDVGGLVGSNYDTVRNSHATNNVTGEWNVGGLVGSNYGPVSNSYSTGSMTGNYYVGGLVGVNEDIVSDSLSTGNVSGNYYVGGLMGSNSGTVTTSYSTGGVTGSSIVSSMVGINGCDGIISNSYCTGGAAGNYYVGGLAGVNFGTVSNSYSRAAVAGNRYVGGLLGVNWGGTATSSFWDTETSGQATSAGGTGKATMEMQDITTFLGAAWDIYSVAPNATEPAYTWNIVDQQTYPFLSWQPVT